jgi:two-component system KDP operon response regulator KdpE
MTAATVLIVDDEMPIRRLLRNALERADYAVVEAVDGAKALETLRAIEPHIVLLDLGLPDGDGLSLVPLIRKMSDCVLLVVSARDETDQKVAALDLGADDYVTKPFDSNELLARVRVALRHKSNAQRRPAIVRKGDLVLDFERRTVRRGDEEIHLTRKEHDVLSCLAAAGGKAVTHQRILQAAWPLEHDRKIEYLRVVVRNLRQKLETPDAVGSVIANELGIGYRLLMEP